MGEKQGHVAVVSMYDAASAVRPLCTCAEQVPTVCAACTAYVACFSYAAIVCMTVLSK